ncbi:MAG: DUF4922 domain-containing protein [Bacteroidales bacterium]|nr:DUF4922 domain-containing protein [Bacteroidales bacterium]
MNLQKKINNLFSTQREAWKLLDDNCTQMSNIELKWLVWGSDAEVVLQYNPSRIISASAKVDKKSIEERKCFLCAENRPDMQQGIPFMDKYIILCNPFPILQNHLTIPLHSHVPQLIGKKINDMSSLAELLPNYIVFYNGAKCGASAPDHFHFQAGLKTKILLSSENSLRSCLRIEGETKEDAEEQFYYVFDYLKTHQPNEEEPMMNIISFMENNKYIIHVFPRKIHRPWQFSAKGKAQILVSPGAVDMAGMIITPRKEDFDKIERNDIEDIYSQVSIAII